MALLSILHYPDERLHLKATPVSEFNAQLKKLVANMVETMRENNGIGLAATQVNIQKRLFIMDLAKEGQTSQLEVFINPVISNKSGEVKGDEGCLSVPGVFEAITRAEKISVDYQDIDGNPKHLECEGLKAICIQHENDHLDGKVFVDYLSALKKNFIKKKMKKLFRE
jgi:peptide deformylase